MTPRQQAAATFVFLFEALVCAIGKIAALADIRLQAVRKEYLACV